MFSKNVIIIRVLACVSPMDIIPIEYNRYDFCFLRLNITSGISVRLSVCVTFITLSLAFVLLYRAIILRESMRVVF